MRFLTVRRCAELSMALSVLPQRLHAARGERERRKRTGTARSPFPFQAERDICGISARYEPRGRRSLHFFDAHILARALHIAPR